MSNREAPATDWCCAPVFWSVWIGVLLLASGALLGAAELLTWDLGPGAGWLAGAGIACVATAAHFRAPHCFVMGPALLAAAVALQLDESGVALRWELVGPGLLMAFGAALLLEEWLRSRRPA